MDCRKGVEHSEDEMKIHTDIQQNSIEWMVLRAGKVTASNADSLVTPLGKVKAGDAAKTLMIQVLTENWIGGSLPSVMGVLDLENGRILEEYARPAFALETGKQVSQVAFIEGDDSRIGCSPDGVLADELAGLEIKCPKMESHFRYLLDGVVPPDYVLQVQFSLYVTQWPAWYFMSFRRTLPPLIIKVLPDEKIQASIKESLDAFFKSHDDAMRKLIKLNGGEPKRSPLVKPFVAPKYTEDPLGDIIL